MFLLNAQFPAVKDFILTRYGLTLITGDFPSFNLSIGGEPVSSFTLDDPNPLFIEFEDCIYYSTIKGKCYEINLHTRSKRLVADRHIAVIGNKEKDFLIGANEGVPHREIIDITTLETRYKFKSLTGHFFFADHFYYTDFGDYTKIFCLSTDTYEPLWELDISEIAKWTNSKGEQLVGELVTIIGLWNNLLLVHVTRNKVLAINSAGCIEWEIDNVIQAEEQLDFPYQYRTDIVATVHWLLHEQQGKLFLIGSHFLFEFDLQSRQRTVLKDYSKDWAWFFYRGALYENYILFSGYKHMSGYVDHIGIIDLLKNEVVWEYKNVDNDLFIRHPVMYNDCIYIKSIKGLLYEFKREK